MSRGQDTFIVERDWNGYAIFVDSKGTFFVSDDDHKRSVEAKTVDGLKRMLAEPPEKLDVKAIMFNHWYSDDEHGRIVKVYGISGIGSVLYEEGGRKQRASRFDKVYVYDKVRLDERKRLRQEKNRIEEALKKLMDDWPLIKGRK